MREYRKINIDLTDNQSKAEIIQYIIRSNQKQEEHERNYRKQQTQKAKEECM